MTAVAAPSPTKRSAAWIVTWASAPTITRMGGAPVKPCVASSHPAAASTWCRPASRQVTLAICAPVTNPTLQSAGSPKSSQYPVGGDLLDDRGGGGHHTEHCILVPRGGQPVGCERGRHRSAGDEAEVPGSGRCDEPGSDAVDKEVDHRHRVLRPVGDGTAQGAAHRAEVRSGCDRSVIEV